ncbi:MAG: hypothetical protein G01um101433_133 [Parcubacteria group bacterium Gr01-1014_33]|nr:MAG: hypothetical protein G01um101433_133 [Parcubacteria group bacterium Gr01-1014_33]
MRQLFKKHPSLDEKSAWIAVGVFFILALGIISRANDELYTDFLTSTEYPIRVTRHNSARAHGLAWIEIHFSDGTKRRFEGEVDSRTYTLSDALRVVKDTGKLTIATKQGKIISINGERPRNGAWAIQRNGKPVQNKIEALTISQGDTYTFFYRE